MSLSVDTEAVAIEKGIVRVQPGEDTYQPKFSHDSVP